MLQNPLNNVEIITFPVMPLGCNCSILICKKTKEAIVVDPGGEVEKIIDHLSKKECEVRWIIHTHAHFDHCSATHDTATYCEAAKDNFKVALHPGDFFLYDSLEMQGQMFGFPVSGGKTEISHHLNDEEILTFGNCKINVLHTPGHTPGSCCFQLDNSGVLFSGDTLFAQGIGRTDLPGGDSNLIFQSIRNRLFTLDESTEVIPGHGGFTRIYEEKRTNPFF